MIWPTPSESDLGALEAASAELLATMGLRVPDPEALELYRAGGAEIEGEVVRLEPGLVSDLLALAPGTFRLHARNPARDLVIGNGAIHRACAYGCAAVSEPGLPWRPSTLSDHVRAAKLVQASESLSIGGGVLAQPTELPAELSGPAMTCASILASDKPLLLTPADPGDFDDILHLAAVPFGGLEALAESPKTLTLVSVASPLTLAPASSRTLLKAVRAGQAVIVTPGPMAGSTGPVTMAGNLAMADAECLAAICLAQLARPGAPSVYGVVATNADLRTGSCSIGGPGYAAQAVLARELARRRALPCRGGGAVTDAWDVSAQSGWESALQLLATSAAGVDVMLHAAGVLGSFGALGFEKLMMDLELIDATTKFLNGIEVSAETLALDVIKRAGHGGEFLSWPHTLKHARREPFHPGIARRGRPGPSIEDSLIEAARGRERRLMAAYEPPEAPFANDLKERLTRLGGGTGLFDTIWRAIHP